MAIGYADDPVVTAWLAKAPGRQVTFAPARADYRVDRGRLVGPQGVLADVADLRRRLPHDITNALAAAATVLEGGVATPSGIAEALSSFEGVPHRISLVAQSGGMSFYDDSKATTPHAVLTAIRAFDRVVLVAGGRNKGLDLRAMAGEPSGCGPSSPSATPHPRSSTPSHPSARRSRATSMDDAVARAAELAEPGDAVLLSPGCASFDWYGGYAERGDDFARAVRARLGARP